MIREQSTVSATILLVMADENPKNGQWLDGCEHNFFYILGSLPIYLTYVMAM